MTAPVGTNPTERQLHAIGVTPTRRALLGLLGASFLVGAARARPQRGDAFLRLWRHLDKALRRRDQAIARRDRLEAHLVRQVGHPRVRLPSSPGRSPHYAADLATIDRAVSLRQHRARLKLQLQRRQRVWERAARTIGLPRAIAAETAAALTVARTTATLLCRPVTTVSAVRLKLAVLIAANAPGTVDHNTSPWAELHQLLADLDRLIPTPTDRAGFLNYQQVVEFAPGLHRRFGYSVAQLPKFRTFRPSCPSTGQRR